MTHLSTDAVQAGLSAPTCHRWCADETPPQKGLRPRSEHPAGPQRCLRASLEPPQPQSRQVTRAFLDVMEALQWGFRQGWRFRSHERIAEKAECAR
jgi:hypothetical protein